MGGSQSHFGDKRALALCTSKYCFSSDATKGGEYVSRITRPRLDFAAQNNKELETFNCLAETRAHFYIYVPFLLLFFFFFWPCITEQGTVESAAFSRTANLYS